MTEKAQRESKYFTGVLLQKQDLKASAQQIKMKKLICVIVGCSLVFETVEQRFGRGGPSSPPPRLSNRGQQRSNRNQDKEKNSPHPNPNSDSYEPECGNGILDVAEGEVCDLKMKSSGSGPFERPTICSADCMSIDPRFMCQTVTMNGVSKSKCKPICGDGIVVFPKEKCDGQEGCMDCKPMEGYYCMLDFASGSTVCSKCGDGKTQGREECDGGDGCTDYCRHMMGYTCTVTEEVSTCTMDEIAPLP